MRFIPYHQLGNQPNIVVDGPANAHTVLTLSHWPHSGTPASLKDDVSAQIVFHYLDHPEVWVNADIVSNNHFDEDGLISLYSLMNPSASQPQRELLIDIAAAGDFSTYRQREAARTTFVISAFGDAGSSPLDPKIFQEPYPKMAGRLYEDMLTVLPEILKDLNRFRPYWEAEDERLRKSEEALRSGQIRIEEIPELDLAIVTLPESLSSCHPMALYNALHTFRVLLMRQRTYELQYRYESWVQYISKTPLPRVDLTPLANRLSERESSGRWVFDGVDEIVPKLALTDAGESAIPPHEFAATIKEYLGRA